MCSVSSRPLASCSKQSLSHVSHSAPRQKISLPVTEAPRSWLDAKARQAATTALLTAVATLSGLPAIASTPYEEARTLVYGPTADGSVRACPSNVNPNCVSTASINQTYGPAWRSDEDNPDLSAQVLSSAVLNLFKGSQSERTQQLPGAVYLAISVDGIFGRDVLEFVIKEDKSAAGGDKPVVTYRSMAGGVKYIWPIQQPVSDFGAQKKRLNEVRQQLGWSIIGCDLLECYQEDFDDGFF